MKRNAEGKFVFEVEVPPRSIDEDPDRITQEKILRKIKSNLDINTSVSLKTLYNQDEWSKTQVLGGGARYKTGAYITVEEMTKLHRSYNHGPESANDAVANKIKELLLGERDKDMKYGGVPVPPLGFKPGSGEHGYGKTVQYALFVEGRTRLEGYRRACEESDQFDENKLPVTVNIRKPGL